MNDPLYFYLSSEVLKTSSIPFERMDLQQDVISPFELEDILTRLKPSPLERVGGPEWSQQVRLGVVHKSRHGRRGEEGVKDYVTKVIRPQ